MSVYVMGCPVQNIKLMCPFLLLMMTGHRDTLHVELWVTYAVMMHRILDY